MPPGPVTVATCTHVFEAEIVRGRLADAGLAAVLRDAEIVTADWTLSVAVGGVKVRVAPADEAAARALLAQPAHLDDYEPPTPAEDAARLALTGALVPTPAFVGTILGTYHLGRALATAHR
ncbi:hypothetical protein [Rubrivirga sp. IMCC45206]|uniref:hypothetical protein n=1 Tax=Rubrivirga sp. IMCC45206 TaxID=3391614 RepID=UPI00399038B1